MARGSRPMFARRRRRPVLLPVLGLLAALLVVPSLLAAAPIDAWNGVGELPDAEGAVIEPDEAATAVRAQPDDVGSDAPPAPATPPFATVGEVTLSLPAPEVVLVGFNEASSRESQAFAPLGRLQDHQNTTKFDAPADHPDGPSYVVLSSRGRPFPATSAIDVLLPVDEAVRSPVDGTVTDVRDYHLYGKHADQRIEIAPVDAPDQRVVMIHLDGVTVSVGDEVVAGETVVAAGARVFPFGSHIDRYTDPDRFPHVHYEFKTATVETEADATEAGEPSDGGGDAADG